MPKFIGNTISGSKRLGDNLKSAPGYVRLSYSQAVLLPSEDVYFSQDTTDKGGKNSLAKRWNRWFASALTILKSNRSTPKMRAAAESELANPTGSNPPSFRYRKFQKSLRERLRAKKS